jgi:glycosyltransferase involved in cell wall biosynthesis
VKPMEATPANGIPASPPKVSILLPNLNNRAFLDERLRSIQTQTLRDWELIVVDSHSNDGAWEFFQECARQDARIRLFQTGEKGIYNNFNRCIRLARSQYVYFATSDDTMTSDALEKMVRALEENPGCDLAHCKLRIIDETGAASGRKFWDDFFIVRYFGDLIDRPHIRKAPHDGVLHFSGITVYTSLTQLLICRRLFDRIGFFPERIGSIADFEWVMSATLVADTVHIPEYLSTWRFHGTQATSDERMDRAKAAGAFLKMARHAVRRARRLNPAAIKPLDLKKLRTILRREKLYYEMTAGRTRLRRGWSIGKWFLLDRTLLLEYRRAHLEGRHFVSQPETLEFMTRMMKEHGLEKNLIPRN